MRTGTMRGAGAATAGLGVLLLAACGGGEDAATATAEPSPSGEPVVAAERLELTGDLVVHDPALVVGNEDHDWYVFSTGDPVKGLGSPAIRRSSDGEDWEYVGTMWDVHTRPEWVYELIPDVEHIWAPDVYEHDGTWYVYYTASMFGTNRSAIGLMTSPTLDPDDPDYGWTDHGPVITSVPGEDLFNAIDPAIVEDEDGTPWMTFGSFFSGIQLIELEWPSGMPVEGAEPQRIAARSATGVNAIEAPAIIHRDGWYYLFVSRDKCCSGVESTYSIAAGRSQEITGPYTDSWFNDMAYDGGDELLATWENRIGPGGQDVAGDYIALHYYDEDLGGTHQLDIRRLGWTEDGWPVARTAEELAD